MANVLLAGLIALAAWTRGPELIEPRAEVSAAVLDGRIYVAGGFSSSRGDLASMEMFDPTVGFWQARAAMPQGLNHLGMAALDGLLYSAGGNVGFTPTNGLLAYDPDLDTWTRRADLPLRRSAHVLVAAAGRLFVVGGVGDEAGITLSYDPRTDTWERRAPMPTLREHLGAAAIDDRIYVIGGRWANQGNLATLEVYDPATDTWRTDLAPMPTARGGPTAVVLDGRLHVLGGEALDSARTYPEHEVYDPLLDTWSRADDLPTSRHGLGSAVLGFTLYTIGGGPRAGFTVSTTVETFQAED